MKKLPLFAIALLFSVSCMAQDQLSFPFQGGKDIMTRFFNENVIVPKDVVKKRVAGTVVFKFTADENGALSKIVIYYADDLALTPFIVEALKKSSSKWIIPNKEKVHDFILPFTIRHNTPVKGVAEVQKTHYEFFKNSKPFVSTDQIPLNEASLLPTVIINYDVAQ
jgi:hypothetical protein